MSWPVKLMYSFPSVRKCMIIGSVWKIRWLGEWYGIWWWHLKRFPRVKWTRQNRFSLMTKSSRIYFSFVQAIQVIKKTRSALIRALLVLLFMQTKGKCMYTFYIMRFFEKTHISVYDGSLKGLCKMIELILGKKLEPNHLQNVLARTNVSRLGLQYIKKNRNKILLIYRHPERYK